MKQNFNLGKKEIKTKTNNKSVEQAILVDIKNHQSWETLANAAFARNHQPIITLYDYSVDSFPSH